MNMNPLSKILGTNLQAFIEKAFLEINGKQLSNLYIMFIVYHLELFLKGEIKKLLVNIPGRHLKTFLCSICFPAFALGINPARKFIIVAYTEELAEDIVSQIREIMESEWYRSVFKTRISEGHSRNNDFKVKGGGRVRSAPMRSVTGKGGDYVIIDDPHNVDDWDNDRVKAKVIDRFEVLMTRRDGGKMSQVLVVGHRVAEDDLSAHIKERGDFKCIRLPLFAPRKMKFELGEHTLTLAKGESLRPDKFPADEIGRIVRFHRGSPAWLYYQQGMGPRGDDFEIEPSLFPFLPTDYGRQLPKTVPIVLSVDPAQKTISTSRNVIHVYAIRGKKYEFIDAFAEKCSFSRLAKKLEQLARRYGAWFIVIEDTARGGDLADEIQKRLNQVHIIRVKPKGKKADRLRKFISIIRAKRISIRRLDAVEAAVDEVVMYPNSPYDDHVDALTNFLEQAPHLDPGLSVLLTPDKPDIGIALGSSPSTSWGQVNGIGCAYRTHGVPSPFPPISYDTPRSRSEVSDFGNLKVRKYRL